MGVYLLHAHVSKQAARFAPRNHANCDDLCTRTGRERFSLVRSFVNMRVIGSPCFVRGFRVNEFRVKRGGEREDNDGTPREIDIEFFHCYFVRWKLDYRGINWGMDIFGEMEGVRFFCQWEYIFVNIFF